MAAGAFGALAQDQGAGAVDDGAGAADSAEILTLDEAVLLPEIVVEGEKRRRSFVETAASVGVVDSQTLERQGVGDLRESFSLLGNVSYFGGGDGNAGFTIRGLSAEGVTQSQNAAPLTGVIVDGVTQSIEAMRRGARGIWDVEQLEVFRGPQSTLQGRGAMAGAVIVKTKDPTFTREAEFRFLGGQGNRREGAFALSGPLVEDVLAVRLSGERRFRERGIDYALPEHETFGEDEFYNLRGKALFLPPGAPGLSFLFTASKSYDKPGLSVSNDISDFYTRTFSPGGDPRVEGREADNLNLSLETKYAFGDGYELTSVTTYAHSDTQIFTPAGFNYQRDASWQDKNITQDLRLSFESPDSDFSGVVGAFFGRFTQPREDVMTYAGLVAQDITSSDETYSFSAYADIDWDVAPKWTVNFGGRLVYERVRDKASFSGFLVGVAPGLPARSFDEVTSDLVFLPKLGLTYAIDDNQTLSASYQRGYRSGFTSVNAADSGAINKVKPDFMDSLELAYRIEAPDRKWRVGLTGFYSLYQDQQVDLPLSIAGVPGGAVTLTQNAAKSQMYGVEIEGAYAFDNGLSLSGSIGLLRTEFLEFGTYSGNQFPDSPLLTLGLGASYEHHSGFFASALVSHTSSYYSYPSIENQENLKTSSFTHVDARVGYRYENVEISLYAENLLDADYITNLNGSPSPQVATVSEPRRFGLEMRLKF